MVDTIAIRGSISEDSALRRHAASVRMREGEVVDLRGETTLPCGVALRFDSWRGHPEAHFEASVPRLVRGSNSHAASLDEAIRLVVQAYEEAGEVVQWLSPPDKLSVMRLDLVRDFTAAEGKAEDHLAGLARVPAKNADTRSHQTPDCLGVETLYRQTTRWLARLYVRDALPHMEAASRGTAQTVRYELQLRSTFLRDKSLQHLEQLSVDPLRELAWHYFKRCRFDVPVGHPERKIHVALAAMATLSPSDRRGILGQLALDCHVGTEPTRDNTVLKYRRLAANYGLTPGDMALWTPQVSSVVRSLDYLSGQLEACDRAA